MMNLQQYIESPSREEKTQLVKNIANTLLNEVGARFLKKSDTEERYVELDRKQIHDKMVTP